MKKPKPQNTKLIKCKHGWRPWSIVCVHLLDANSMEWIPLPQDQGSKYNDWLCPECYRNWEKIVKDHNLEDIRPICVDCVETIRRVFDPKYEGGSDDVSHQIPT
jgi:hypothetical protein